MHSSRMRTARSLTISRHVLCMPPATMHGPRNHACPPQLCTPPYHACPPQPCMPPLSCMPPCNHACPPYHACPHNHTCPLPPPTTHAPPPATHACPPVNRITDTCKNITFPQLRLRAGINAESFVSLPYLSIISVCDHLCIFVDLSN